MVRKGVCWASPIWFSGAARLLVFSGSCAAWLTFAVGSFLAITMAALTLLVFPHWLRATLLWGNTVLLTMAVFPVGASMAISSGCAPSGTFGLSLGLTRMPLASSSACRLSCVFCVQTHVPRSSSSVSTTYLWSCISLVNSAKRFLSPEISSLILDASSGVMLIGIQWLFSCF